MNTSIGFRVNTVEKEKLSKLAIEKKCSISELSRTATLNLLTDNNITIYNKDKLSKAMIQLYDLISAEENEVKRTELIEIVEVVRCLI